MTHIYIYIIIIILINIYIYIKNRENVVNLYTSAVVYWILVLM